MFNVVAVTGASTRWGPRNVANPRRFQSTIGGDENGNSSWNRYELIYLGAHIGTNVSTSKN